MDSAKGRLRAASVWSGGKDGCLACFKAIQQGYKIKYLFNLFSKRDALVSFHRFPKGLIRMQSEASGIPIFQEKICPQEENKPQFERELEELLLRLRKTGIQALVLGYVLAGDYQRALVSRLCLKLGLKLVEPLYKRNSKRVVREFIRLGFKAIIVSVDTRIIDSYWVGRALNEEFIEYLESKPGIDFCGDHGEYHTFTTGGPLFKRAVYIYGASKVHTDSSCFLDIHKYGFIKQKIINS